MSHPRRVSYILPAPTPTTDGGDGIPLLDLPPIGTPRNGRTAPIIRPSAASSSTPSNSPAAASAHGHCLGVNALALDTTTTLHGRPGPEGILYTAGRDGLVASWELGMGLEQREKRTRGVRWERLEDADGGSSDSDSEGGGDESSDDDDDDELVWESPAVTRPAGPSAFRQSVQTHTDWVNDIILCNSNSTLISASSDRTIRAWSPHTNDFPSLIGAHRDYVKTLALAPQPSLLFSGGLDRRVLAWDLHEQRPDPINELQLEGSVYALVSSQDGTLVAAGTPERAIQLWDPRMPHGHGSLVGHSDNVRALLLSADGRYALSGSSDATVKLWSLGERRCMHTFAHHADPVWALASNSPQLERFYSGDREGYLCVTDVRASDKSWDDASCTLVAQETAEDGRRGTEGICQIVALDEEYVWTATGAASVKRWRDARRPHVEASSTAPRRHLLEEAEPLMRMDSRDSSRQVSFAADLLRTTAAASGAPIPSSIASSTTASPSRLCLGTHLTLASREVTTDAEPLRATPDAIIPGRHGLVRALVLNDRQHVLAADTSGQVSLWNIIRGECVGRFSDVSVSDHADHPLREIGGRDAKEALEVVREHIEGEAATVTWCSVDTRIGSLTVHIEEGRAFDAEVYADEVLEDVTGFREDQRLNLGKWMLANLFEGLVRAEGGRAESAPGEFAPIRRSNTRGGLAIGMSTPALTPAILPQIDTTATRRPLEMIPQSPATPAKSPSTHNDYFSIRPSPTAEPTTPGFMNRFKKKQQQPQQQQRPEATAVPETPTLAAHPDSAAEAEQLRLLAAVRSHPFAPPPPTEAPPLPIPRSTALLIAEESRDAGAWAVTYRSMVSRTDRDVEPLEMAAPHWVLDYLFAGRNRVKDPVKLCFVLEPWAASSGDGEQLPAMPDGNSRLTANRVLRIRKVLQYVGAPSRRRAAQADDLLQIYDRLELPSDDTSTIGNPYSSISLHRMGQEAAAAAPPPELNAAGARAQNHIEVVCNGVVVPPEMTLAAVRQFIWMSPMPTGFTSAGPGGGQAGGGQALPGGGDVTLYYRRKHQH